MRFVPDAVRDILLYIEQNQKAKYDHKGVFEVIPMSPKYILDELGESSRFTREEGEYAIRLLYEKRILLGSHTTGKKCSYHNFNNYRNQFWWTSIVR